jgi:hypothetical protein
MRTCLLAISFIMGSLLTSAVLNAQTLEITPITTLQAETSNNTSAAPGFKAQTNGNAGAGNVSKVDIHSLLYPGATTQIFAELQPWFGDKRHMQVGYTSWSPAQVEKQLEDMESRGATGVVIDWYGPADDTEATTLAWLAAAANHPDFKIIIMIDKGAVTLSPCKGCNPQQTMIYLTNYVLKHYATSPSYATLDGKPIITQFDLDLDFPGKFDWAAIQAATSSNVAWIFENSGGFTHPVTSGSWSWMNATSKQYGMDYLTNFYNAAMATPKLQAWGAGYKGFNDTLASWTLDRIVGQQCGQTWLETFKKINSYYDSGKQLPILQLVTWNDYEEGTEIETGIDNCVSVSASVSKNTLSWKMQGNPNTVDHYDVYISNDGVNLMLLNTMDMGSQSLDLCSYSPANAKYVAYVEAVGKPSLKNQMSNAVNFSTTCVVSIPPPPPPTLSLGATPTAIEIPSGQTGSASVSVIPVGGAVNSAVALSCSDLPAELQCLFAPASVTPGANTASSTLSISSGGVARLQSPTIPRRRPYSGLLFANLGVAGLVFAGGACSRKRIRQLLLIGTLSVMAAMLGGCSIGKSSTMQNSPAGPVVPVVPAAKTYTITLNGDGGTQHISTQVTVTVK